MKTPLLSFLFFLVIFGACISDRQPASAVDYSLLVNPFIGTDFTGNTYPGAQAPFGMVQLSPDNGLPGWDRISGYYYPDSTIAGFSHTHLSGTGAGDLYDISYMPVTLPYREAEAPLGIHSKFRHSDEEASAGYYRVLLKDYNINVELTATERCGIQRYTFPKAQSAVFLNLKKAMNWDFTQDSHIEVVDSCTIQGYRFSDGWARGQRVFFRTRFSKPFRSSEIDTTAIIQDGKTIGTAYVARFNFDTTDGEEIVLCTALSGVSMEGAAGNLAAEAPHNDFDKYVAETKENWNRQLGKIEVRGICDLDDKVNFYTALYRTMIAPTVFSDVDGSYYGPDKKIHKADGWVNYGTFSLWDTFRAAHPLYTLMHTHRIPDFVKSMMRQYDYYGYLPVWQLWGQDNYCMIGNHSIPVIVDAVLKGVAGVDEEKAYEAVFNSSIVSHPNSPFEVWEKYGYMPENIQTQSVSITLEQAFDDWCVAQLAKRLGKEKDYNHFMKRSAFYRNLFNSKTGFFQPKNDKGEWIEPFDPYKYGANGGYPFTEGNAWQYFWYVPQNIPDLISLTGGNKAFVAKLDTFFTVSYQSGALNDNASGFVGQYAHGNEPSHHVAYLYACAGEPWKTQKYVAYIMNELYNDSSSGYAGNDDCGEMSAWYVFGALGFYPVNPVSGEYVIGTPMLEEAVIQLPGRKTFTVKAPRKEDNEVYICSMKLNGEKYTKNYITHQDIMKGGILEFVMTASPGK